MFLGSGEPYPLRSIEDVLTIIDGPLTEAGAFSVGLLADLFHLGAYGADIVSQVDKHADRIRHVQVADFSGRHEPGTGGLPIKAALERLSSNGYDGYVSCEYHPTCRVEDGLSWIEEFHASPS